jgi:hypothetical protein
MSLRRLVTLVGLLARLLGIGGGDADAGRAAPAFGTTAHFAAGLSETSGVAVSRRHPGVLWVHEDSGSDPVIHATNTRGADLGSWRVTGAAARDWEDIAPGPCPSAPSASCLYIADTGDNDEKRRDVTVYIVPEPDPAEARPEPEAGRAVARPAARTTQPATALRVHYPDGPHDVEGIAVSPAGEISLVTKGRDDAVRRFRVSPARAEAGAVLAEPAELLYSVPAGSPDLRATGAAFSPDGKLLAVRSYTEIRFYRVVAEGRLERGGPACAFGLREPQGEGVDFLDGETLVLTSESPAMGPGSITTVRCPMGDARPGKGE